MGTHPLALGAGVQYLPLATETWLRVSMPLLNSELEGYICSPSRLRALSDQELVAALRSGCNDALAVLFERHNALVFERAHAILQDDCLAEEIVREVFLDVCRKVSQLDPAENFQLRLLRYANWRIINRKEGSARNGTERT
jgi:hypothetical protein